MIEDDMDIAENILHLSKYKIFYNERKKPDEILLKYNDFLNLIDLIEDLHISNKIKERLVDHDEFVDMEDIESLNV